MSDVTRAELAQQRTGADITHVVWPACQCGHAFAAHCCQGWHPLMSGPEHDKCSCLSYAPNGQVEEFTAVYRPWDTTRGMRRLACRACWWLERRARRWRHTWERKP